MVNAAMVDADSLKTWADIVGTAITALAVLMGGFWGYFKFAKGRTFRPRLEVRTSGHWAVVDGKDLLHAQIVLKNIGASKIKLRQKGTGLAVDGLAQEQPAAPTKASWTRFRVFEVFLDHAWIEPGETIAEEVLLDLGVEEPVTTLLHVRLVLSRMILGNIEVNAQTILPIVVDGITSAQSDGHELSEVARFWHWLQSRRSRSPQQFRMQKEPTDE